jgi:tetratricopeptide (TPR) repeat protein
MHDDPTDDDPTTPILHAPRSTEATDDRPPATRLAWATAAALREGDLEAAQHHCDAALAIARGQGHPGSVASVQTILGRVLRSRGELDAAGAVLEAALDVQRRLGNERSIATTLLELGGLHATRGSLDGAQAAYMEALTRFARLKASVPEAQAQAGIASVHHAAGRHVEVAQGVARKADDQTLQAMCFEVLGALEQESDRRLRARQAYRDAASTWHRLSDRPGEARCQLALARLSFDDNEPVAEALDGLEQASAVQRQPWLMGQVACLRGAALGRRGDRLAYTVLAHAAALLDGHPAWRHQPSIEQGHLDLARGDDDAAYGRLGAVPPDALRSVQVRLALSSLRRRLGQALQRQAH